jgi:hypothetical protein
MIFFIVLLFSVGLHVLVINAQPSTTSQWIAVNVTVDGMMSSGEWDDATETHMSTTTGFELFRYVKNNDEWIDLCFDVVSDTSHNINDSVTVIFDTGHDGVLTGGSEDTVKCLAEFPSIVMHMLYVEGTGTWGVYDLFLEETQETSRDAAGLKAVSRFGKSPNSAVDHEVFEFRIPLALGDLDTSPGCDTGVFTQIYDSEKDECSNWPEDAFSTNPELYEDLKIAMDPEEEPSPPEEQKPLCFIATAVYGSALSPEVQFLRGYRENVVYGTFAGSCFMDVFNTIYYSFSPIIAQIIVVHPWLKTPLQLYLSPMMKVLGLSSDVYYLFQGFNSEIAIIISGMMTSFLIGVIYYLPPLVLLSLLFKRRINASKWTQRASVAYLVFLGLLMLGEVALSRIVISSAYVLALFSSAITLILRANMISDTIQKYLMRIFLQGSN